MKYASEDLMNEHEGILNGLSILEKMIAFVESGKTGMQNDIASMIDFLKLFADKCHHGKEEGILFPTMEKYGIPNERGPIGQMLSEHEEGRKFIRGLSDSIVDGTLNKEVFIANGKDYIKLLRSHIQKENNILFPMGDRAIPEGEQQHLLEAFEDHEKTVMGEGIHEKLHAMLDEFAHKYI